LGWNFRKYGGTLLIKPSRKNAKALYDKVAEVIKSHLMVKQVVLIEKLNPILRGWAQYHQPVVAKETFSKMDSLIHWRLTRWARRRHPKKSRCGASRNIGNILRTDPSLSLHDKRTMEHGNRFG
jgi:RNA-directed DNA polymerase